MKFASAAMGLFLISCAIFIPFPYDLVPFLEKVLNVVLAPPMAHLGSILGLQVSQPQISSDSATMYTLVLALVPFALLMATVVWRFSKNDVWLVWVKTFLRLFLSLHLMSYGCDKLFKGQFYLPEPNILFTEFGRLDRDILFWSTLGTSYTYSVFTGLVEVMAAVFLWFRKTRIVGLLLALAAMVHVVLINFSFNISVKLFSTILLFISLFLLSPHFKSMWRFLAGQEITKLQLSRLSIGNRAIAKSMKFFAVGFILLEAIYPNLVSGNWNDDLAQRPYLHGAYKVMNQSPELPKRVFVHRMGYLIVQAQNGDMESFSLEVDRLRQKLQIQNSQGRRVESSFSVTEENILEMHLKGQRLKMQKLKWRELPALQNSFHWTVDEVGR